MEEVAELREAIGRNDLVRVDALLTASAELRPFLIDETPLQALAQPGRIPMMEILVRHRADVNGLCWGWFPVLFLGTRSASAPASTAGARTRYDAAGVLPLLRNRNEELAALIDVSPSLVYRRYPELDSCGNSGGRLLTLRGATLLHVAAEYGFLEGGPLSPRPRRGRQRSRGCRL